MKGFQKFLEFLDKEIIKVNIIAIISKSGMEAGRYRNKNLVFMLKKKDIDYLYDYDHTYY